MRPVRTAHSNMVYTGPPGVRDLYAQKALVQPVGGEAHDGIVSVWEPTPAERQRIAAGENVRLCIGGDTHPTVVMDVVDEQGVGEDAPAVRQRLASLDGPPCPSCGSLTQRTGTCHTCIQCGTTTGCG